MRLRFFVAAALFFSVAVPAFSQVVPAATEGPMHLQVGVGFADYIGDLDNGRLTGGSLWVDCFPCNFPRVLHGFGLEAEARAVRSPNTLPSQIGAQQEASAGGGPTYTMTRFRRFRPYAKFDIEYGGADFNLGNPYFHHLSQVMYAPGGGIEYRAYRNIWVRADYEYQIWPHAFGGTFDLDPQGVTVGAAWEFRAPHRH
jgi:hypothetical protein